MAYEPLEGISHIRTISNATNDFQMFAEFFPFTFLILAKGRTKKKNLLGQLFLSFFFLLPLIIEKKNEKISLNQKTILVDYHIFISRSFQTYACR